MAERDFYKSAVVITGAASGIGRATAELLSEQGAVVHLADVNAEELSSFVDALRKTGRRATGTQLDVRDRDAVVAWAKSLEAENIDVVVNNAGIGHLADFEATPIEEWRRVMDINLFGAVHVTGAFLPALKRARTAHIINLASVAGLVGFPKMTPYSASKFAVVGFTEALAAELASTNIRVSAICPGMVNTNIIKNGILRNPGAATVSDLEKLYSHRGASPADIASTILDVLHHPVVLCVPGPDAKPLWWLKRASSPLSAQVVRWFAKAALGG